jgi:hypothetical protein
LKTDRLAYRSLVAAPPRKISGIGAHTQFLQDSGSVDDPFPPSRFAKIIRS